MSMARATHRSGLAFLLVGLLGGLFFWLTDPRFGPRVHQYPRGHLIGSIGSSCCEARRKMWSMQPPGVHKYSRRFGWVRGAGVGGIVAAGARAV